MTGKDRMAYNYISIYKKKRINVYFYTKNYRFFDLYYYGLLEVGK